MKDAEIGMLAAVGVGVLLLYSADASGDSGAEETTTVLGRPVNTGGIVQVVTDELDKWRRTPGSEPRPPDGDFDKEVEMCVETLPPGAVADMAAVAIMSGDDSQKATVADALQSTGFVEAAECVRNQMESRGASSLCVEDGMEPHLRMLVAKAVVADTALALGLASTTMCELGYMASCNCLANRGLAAQSRERANRRV